MALFRELGMKHEFAITLCELAHLKLHKGEAVNEELNQVQAIAQELSIVPTSVLAKSVAQLERAMAAQERGETLRFGQCLDDYPEALRNKWTSQ